MYLNLVPTSVLKPSGRPQAARPTIGFPCGRATLPGSDWLGDQSFAGVIDDGQGTVRSGMLERQWTREVRLEHLGERYLHLLVLESAATRRSTIPSSARGASARTVIQSPLLPVAWSLPIPSDLAL